MLQLLKIQSLPLSALTLTYAQARSRASAMMTSSFRRARRSCDTSRPPVACHRTGTQVRRLLSGCTHVAGCLQGIFKQSRRLWQCEVMHGLQSCEVVCMQVLSTR